ncbi:beta-ketoacyl synthase [Gluconacetobacter johannae DSM 13595]|uniref:SDR family NAD(P)-dependent oxidoreductase n=1 Tax=Gluconacetobacter johannae TaxID=112140 RepID=A0A7W4P4L0_9PROT|nr:type I polyketide synthase [Gluconacetobacter johannae]MBB2177162.1 SDR family NAD(P)-dependent oxidoreductase [Gluconacetobacter johannae]GBQ91062.1 beta-ketoacyl synthase [Gluconacetobacter johannae DSM 13595]
MLNRSTSGYSADNPEEPIAIIGASCRLPGATDLAGLWQLLDEERESVRPIPENRFPLRDFWHPRRGEPGKFYATHAATLDNVELFDAAFFGISAREARQIDPQQRLLLELAWEALEDAGTTPDAIATAGVYIGASGLEYANQRLTDPSSSDAYFMPGNTLSIFANRISHALGLRGPSMTIDTACSSSLFALHTACEDLRAGRTDMAMVGGVSMLLSPYPFIGFCAAGMLSPTGRCHSFSADADGYVRGEGGVMLLLKPLSAARRDGDDIRAVILGTAVNADGRTPGLTFPSAKAQTALLREIYDRAGISPEQLAFVEAHGTGTPAGDPVETTALGTALGQPRSTPLPIGSVKTNVGHLEPASGLVSLLKAMLALQKRRLPASLHCENPNPAIPFAALNLDVVTKARPLGEGPLIAGINNFGFGGANAHAILASAPIAPPQVRPPAPVSDDGLPLLLSARSEAGLRSLARIWSTTPWTDADLRGMATRRAHLAYRLGVPAGDAADMRAALATWADARAHPDVVTGQALAQGRTVFVFSGNGTQFPGMGKDLLDISPAFAAGLAEADAALRPHLGWSVLEAMRSGDWSAEPADIAQPMLFAFQIGVLRGLAHQGMRADIAIGHSVGEIAAAFYAGTLDLAEAARIVVLRSRHQATAPGGGMAALHGDVDAARRLMEQAAPGLEIAAYNAPNALAVAGDVEALDLLEAANTDTSLQIHRLKVGYAYHSSKMDPIAAPLIQDLGPIAARLPDRALISTVTGQPVSTLFDTEYWWRNVRAPVLFAEGVRQAAAQGGAIFIEIGPRPVLQHYLRDILRDSDVQSRVMPAVPAKIATDPFPRAALACFAAGGDILSASCFIGPAQVRGLPGVQWQRERHWFAPTEDAAVVLWDQQNTHPLMGARGKTDPNEWIAHLDSAVQPWLADHMVGDTIVLAAACMIEFAFTAARAAWPAAQVLELRDFQIMRPVIIDPAHLREIRVRLAADGTITIDSRPRLAQAVWTRHATTRAGVSPVSPVALPPATTDSVLAGDALYATARAAGLAYGPAFQRVGATAMATDRVDVTLTGQSPITGLTLDPTALDGTFQALVGLAVNHAGPQSAEAPLPRKFGTIRLDMTADAPVRGQAAVTTSGPRETEADIVMLDAAGRAVLSATACWFTRMPGERPTPVAERSFHEIWLPSPIAPAPLSDDCFLALRPALETPAGDADDRDAGLLAQAFLAACAAPETPPAEGPGDASDLARIWQTLFLDLPQWLPAALLLAWVGERCGVAGAPRADVAAGDDTFPDVAFRQLLSGRAVELAAAQMADAIAAYTRDWPQDRPVRVLELHADRGTLARQLAPRLTALPTRLDYTVLEPNRERQARLRPTLLAHRPGIVLAETVPAGAYDVLVAYTPGLHGVVPAAILAQADRLAPGGLILVAEAAEDSSWTTLRGLSTDPLTTIAAWRELPHRLRAVAESTPGQAPFPLALLAAVAAEAEDPLSTPDAPPTLAPMRLSYAPQDQIADDDTAQAGTAETTLAARAMLALAHDARQAAEAGERLAVITRDAGRTPHEAARVALARTIANEFPSLRCRRIDLSSAMTEAGIEDALRAEGAATDDEREVRWTPDGRLVRRLREGLPDRAATPASDPVRLIQPVPGPLDRLCWMPQARTQPGPRDVVIDVRASGLNYRDVLSAIGMLPDELLLDGFAGATLGMECTGIVEAVGAEVIDLAPGDRVMALSAAAHASRVMTDRRSVLPLPDWLSFSAGATVPVAYLTVLYALETVGSLQAGETVLIHGAAGGVGLAAIQYASHVGARVIATAGSPAKRAALRRLGIETVLDSRSLRFGADVLDVTGGQGVDAVLNALSGDAMERSLELLRPFGRFLELGKRDFLANTRVGIGPLRQNVSYHAIDVDALVRHRPELVGALTQRLHALLEEGALGPLPYTSFPAAAATDAFALMRTSAHVGKIVLTMGPVHVPPSLDVPADRTVLVTGGTGGFGARAALWLVSRGARHLVLVSRRGPAADGVAALRATLLEAGALTVEIRACDVTHPTGLAALIDDIRATLPPLGGIVHAAVSVADGLVSTLSEEQVTASVQAKLGGALALDRLTRDDPLSLFLVFSSATITLGAPGQGAYVAANAAVEALIQRRRDAGLPGCAVRWGPIADAGFLERNAAAREALDRRLGAQSMRSMAALDALPDLLVSSDPCPVLADMDWQATGNMLPILDEPLFGAVARRRDEDSDTGDLMSLLATATEERRREIVADVILGELTRIMQADREALPLDQPLAELGMDSLTAVELALGLERRLGVSLPGFAWQEMTVGRVARQVTALLGNGGQDATAPAEAVLTRHLSDEERKAVSASPEPAPQNEEILIPIDEGK